MLLVILSRKKEKYKEEDCIDALEPKNLTIMEIWPDQAGSPFDLTLRFCMTNFRVKFFFVSNSSFNIFNKRKIRKQVVKNPEKINIC